MTDHEKLLVAVLSETADMEQDDRELTAPAVMTLLYESGFCQSAKVESAGPVSPQFPRSAA